MSMREKPRIMTLMTNHAHVLCILAVEPTIRVRDLAARVALTQRGVLRIVSELEAAGCVRRRRCGRRNVYEVDHAFRPPHVNERHLTVGALISTVGSSLHAR
jgi:DNA-binding Lrp family transcriptional regulator